jgi:DNA-binding transcriptional regulator GbsR (MarR family)
LEKAIVKGHMLHAEKAQRRGALLPWESIVADAVGNAIEFWGFKANQGRVWAVLYLRDRPLNAAEVQHELGISKGATSMVLRELESWGVVNRVRLPRTDAWHFEAETDLLRMVRRVISDREAPFIARVESDLAEAERLARAARDADGSTAVERIAQLRRLASLTRKAIGAFLKTSRLDVGAIAGVLRTSTGRLLTATERR